jgi:hypothetical protein
MREEVDLMRLRSILLAWIGVSLIALNGCTHIRVSADWDPSVSLREFRTFAWLPGSQRETGNVRLDNPLLDKRIRRAINQQLQIQGYSEAPASGADFLLGYHLSLDRKLQVNTINDYYGYGYRRYGYWGGGYGGSRTYVTEYDVGILIIDMVERAANELVWRGTGATRVRDESTPAEADRSVARVVAKILEQFPPTP